MAGMGAGYDLSVSTFSPDGRVFQVEYAAKAAEKSLTALAMVCKDGAVVAIDKPVLSKMSVPGTAPRVLAVDRHATIVTTGFAADGRQIAVHARDEAREYRRVFATPIPGKVLAERIGLFMHAYTLPWSVRPFGTSVLLVVRDGTEPELYSIETNGTNCKYFATSVGKGSMGVKTELEKLSLKTLTAEDALVEASRILIGQRDEGASETRMEIEMGWLAEASGWTHEMVPRERVRVAVERAEKLLADMEE